jgi:hypothetical protein
VRRLARDADASGVSVSRCPRPGRVATLDGRAGAAASSRGRHTGDVDLEPRQPMAGKHARPAPLVISGALATLVASALLLAVGVVAVTVFTGGERPATGGPGAGVHQGAAGPSVPPTAATGVTSGAGPGGNATGRAEGSGPPSPAGSGDVVELATWGGTGPTPAGRPPTLPTSTGSPSSGGASPAALPGVVPEVVTWPRGWAQRSDTGRAHGRAVGLLRRVAAGHGCRPLPSKARPVPAQPEPAACR